jgi:hypothetical protein
MKVLAGGRTPQLERCRQTCSMRLKNGACHITNMVRAPEDKWRNEKFQGDHLHEIVPLPNTPGDWRVLFPAEDPLDLWWRSPAAGAVGGGGEVCGLGSGGGGGVAGRSDVGGGGGICCSGEGRRASSGLLSGSWCCGGGGGALLCLSAIFWRLGAGSPTKEPTPRWSLRDLDPSAWLLHAGAAPAPRRPSGSGRHPHCPCGGAPAPAPYLTPSRRGPDLRDLAPRDLGWRAAGSRVRPRGCESRDWGRLPAAG